MVVCVLVREWVLGRRSTHVYCVIWERMNNETRSSGSRNIDAAKYSSLSDIDDLIQSRTWTITPIHLAFTDFKAPLSGILDPTLQCIHRAKPLSEPSFRQPEETSLKFTTVQDSADATN